MAIENEGVDPQAQESPNSPAPATDEAPAWFKSFVEQTDKRFEGLAAKLREPAAKAESKAQPANGQATMEDVKAAVRFGEMRQNLPEAARNQLDTLEGQGFSVSQLMAVAQAMRAVRGGAAPAQAAGPVPAGVAPAAAAATGMRFPASVSELRALKAKNPEGYAAVMAHPDFDVSKISRR